MYTRDEKRANQAVKRIGDKVVATEPVRLMFPTRWLERGLAVIQNTITVLGFVAIVTDDGKYGVTKVTGYLRTEPNRISQETVNGEACTVFWYNKGACVIASTDIVVIDNLVHPIYTELLGKGRIPWYYNYMDFSSLFENIPYYNGVDKQGDPALWSFMAASASRDPDNPQRYYRQRKEPTTDRFEHPPVLLGLKLVSYHGSNLIAKQGGSYYDSGTTSSLANPSKRVERMELVLTQT